MTRAAPVQSDPCPPSAVSHGAGLVGLVGLFGWVMLARHFGWNGPNAALVCCVATGLPMVLWSIFVDKVHLRPSTGIDWSQKRAVKDVLDISTIKLTGLWLTWSLIAAIYASARWYWTGNYQFSMAVFISAAPFLFFLSIPYVIWIDRFLAEPRDGAWHFGAMISGQPGWDKEQIWHHLRAWG